MRTSNRIVRMLVTVVAIALLMVPRLVMAIALGGAFNLEVAAAAVAMCVAAAIWLRRWKWVAAIIASLVIAIPPFPYWSSWDEKNGRYFHFFNGYGLQDLPIVTFTIYFLVSMLLFSAIFWAIWSRLGGR